MNATLSAPYTSETKAAAVKPFRPLTPAQERVACLVAKGLGWRAIATQLGCSRYTVRSHIRAIADLLPDDGLPAKQRVQIWAMLRAA